MQCIACCMASLAPGCKKQPVCLQCAMASALESATFRTLLFLEVDCVWWRITCSLCHEPQDPFVPQFAGEGGALFTGPVNNFTHPPPPIHRLPLTMPTCQTCALYCRQRRLCTILAMFQSHYVLGVARAVSVSVFVVWQCIWESRIYCADCVIQSGGGFSFSKIFFSKGQQWFPCSLLFKNSAGDCLKPISFSSEIGFFEKNSCSCGE